MPTSGKVFRLTEPMSLEGIKKVIEGYSHSETAHGFELMTDITDIRVGEDDLYGRHKFDLLIEKWHRGTSRVIPYTTSAPFLFFERGGDTYLLVIIKKAVANNVANFLSVLIFGEIGCIIECRISGESLSRYSKSSEKTKIMLLTDFMIPGMNKLTIYGDDVIDSQAHDDYGDAGDAAYVVLKTKQKGFTVGVTGEASLTIFSTIDEGNFIEYVKDEFMPLIQ